MHTLDIPGAALPRGQAGPTAPRHRDWSNLGGSVALVAVAVWMVISAPRISIALIPAVVYELAFALAFLMRGEARATLHGWGPRIAAYGGSFLLPAFLAIAAHWIPSWVAPAPTVMPALAHILGPVGLVLITMGTLVSAWGLWYLRASVSLVPAARGLVTTGPYAIARHPLYLAYVLSYAGLLLQHPTPVLGAVIAIWFAMTLARVRYEESVLETVFPEYDAYRRRVGAFGPRIDSVI